MAGLNDDNGVDLKALLKMFAPVAGGLAMGGGPAQAAFQQAFLQGQQLAKQERERKQASTQKQAEVGANFMLDIGQHAQQLDDPVAFAQFMNLAEDAGTKAGYVKPGDLKSRLTFPESKLAGKKLKELTDQLDTLEKGGYNLDELAQGGSHLELKDGTQVPIATAVDLTRKRPIGLDGQPVPKPKKLPVQETRSLDVQAAEALARGDQATYERLLKVKKEMGQANDRPRDPQFDDLNRTMKELQIDSLRARLEAGKNTAKDDTALVNAVVANPALYDRLTAKEITAIAPQLAAAGFTFGKGLNESAVQKIAESKSAIASLKDLREVLQKNEKYLGPVAGLAALNPYSEARKAQADIDRVRQRVGKALEGGVLRKEDEEKYKKILATLRDEPTTAIYKIDQMLQNLENDLKMFEDTQRGAGRRVPSRDGAPAGGAGPQVGERRMINGQLGEWDGKGWKPVQAR